MSRLLYQWYTLGRRLGGHQTRSWRYGKKCLLAADNLTLIRRPSSTKSSHYTERAIVAYGFNIRGILNESRMIRKGSLQKWRICFVGMQENHGYSVVWQVVIHHCRSRNQWLCRWEKVFLACNLLVCVNGYPVSWWPYRKYYSHTMNVGGKVRLLEVKEYKAQVSGGDIRASLNFVFVTKMSDYEY